MVIVYRLVCVHTGECYVGVTAGKLGKRMNEHRSLLRSRKHSSQRMQQLWEQYGESGFRMEPVTELPKDTTVIQKRKAELALMELYDSKGLLLNHCKASFSPPEGAQAKAVAQRVANGYRPSEESNKKRRQAQLGKPKGHGAKISAAKKGKPQRTGKCQYCGREVTLSNLPRHEGPCRRKMGNDIVSSAPNVEGAGALDKEPGT